MVCCLYCLSSILYFMLHIYLQSNMNKIFRDVMKHTLPSPFSPPTLRIYNRIPLDHTQLVAVYNIGNLFLLHLLCFEQLVKDVINLRTFTIYIWITSYQDVPSSGWLLFHIYTSDVVDHIMHTSLPSHIAINMMQQ